MGNPGRAAGVMKIKILWMILLIPWLSHVDPARPASADEAKAIDLSGRFEAFPPPPIKRNGPKASMHRFPVYRSGTTRNAIVLETPARIRASLAGISGSRVLTGSATHLYNIGDGLQLDIVLIRSGVERIVYSRYFDPGRKLEDRSWISFEVPLDLDGAADSLIELRVSAGPQGDLTADWLGIGPLWLQSRKNQ
jgi:hypothetical protein